VSVRQFVPWYRTGFSTALSGAPAAGSARARLPATVGLTGHTGTTALPVALAGPGDVVGLDPFEISRCEPFDGCPDFETGYFPYVELTSPDLPWRFTPIGAADVSVADPEPPHAPHTGTRLQPWLALAVVPADLATLQPADSGGLPVLSTIADQLPPCGETWAWAHIQVTSAAPLQTDADLAAALADPSTCVTRLICPRRLVEGTRYGAYLVPTFAAGAAIVPGAPAPANPLGPAWPATGPVRLPVYYQWSFTTGAGGTFETLARRLRPRTPPAESAGRPIDTGAPGWGSPAAAGRTTIMQGALRPLATSEAAPDAALADSLRAAVSSTGIGVTLLPPLYGQDFQHGATAIDPADTGWLRDLNADARRRIAAGLAAWVVTVAQEDLADEAWRQLAAAGVPATPAAATSQLASVVAANLADRHRPVTDQPAALLRAARRAALPRTAATSAPTSVSTDQATFAPIYDTPAYELLRAVAPEWLLPGVESIPLDSVVLMVSNVEFVEAFLVGLNHSLAQELIWRGYPLDRGATMFARFWGAIDQVADIDPIASWDRTSVLGTHAKGADHAVLLLRGSLFARFPTLSVYLSRDSPTGEQTVQPDLSGRVSADCIFAGFAVGVADLGATPTDGGAPWRIVLQEAVEHARFGVDDPSGTSDAPPATWQDLDWGQAQLRGQLHVPVGGAALGGITRPLSAGSADTATWGLSSGHLASAVQQPAFRIRILTSLWLTSDGGR
jgi:hypothetical protein